MKRRVPLMVRLTRFLVGFKMTPFGRVAVLGIFLGALGGVTIEIPVYQIFCGWVCLFGFIETTGILLRPKLELKAWFPEKVIEGESVTGYVDITNVGMFPACDIMCALLQMPEGMRHLDADYSIPSIPKGKQMTLPVTVQASKRGNYILPGARIHSTFPFNLMRFGKAQTDQWELQVLPAFSPLEQFEVPFSRKSQADGVSAEIRVGDSPEYIGNRDYTPGEPVRRLDFKAWARVGRPVVREYQDEFNSQAAIFLDTHLPRRWGRARKDRLRLDAAVSLTAAIAHQMDQHDASVEVFLAGADLFLFQPAAGVTHFESVMEVLSVTELTNSESLSQLAPVIADSLEDVSVVFCVFVDWDESREQFVRGIVESGCAVRLLLVSESEPDIPVPYDEGEFTTLNPRAILLGEVREL
ncbi:DUF58 domain-containing protein [Thalassoglobus polymorphus]|uniref:DUF58 domain-containing protein n=1 Tax=Thalassoglobus polymorphus TaxID=2527994 RepID=A0A517QHB8_9PLAN|nr:DUF58 domain-containing protein [Thalassoglobus polymorphus]QDT31005.1 hypothetical protein Mal48_02350 [Thalassoglobus polymorphus]